MGKIAAYLRAHLDGDITDSSDAREFFSRDAGLIPKIPQAIVYPATEQDVRKVARFAWQLGEKGKSIGITSRGLGSDWTGAAVGEGLILAFPAHMNKILELDSRKRIMVVEAGAMLGKVAQALITHGLALSVEPLSSEYSTFGGAIASNATGPKGAKYGPLSRNVTSLRVVLSNGEVLDTGRISKREVRKRMGLTTFEGEIYRGIDALLNENEEVLSAFKGSTEHAPINIFDVRHSDGSVDLTPLFIGSQGTLGIITQAHVRVGVYNPAYRQVVCGFYDEENFNEAMELIAPLKPAVCTVLTKRTLKMYQALNPEYLKKHFGERLPEYAVLLEWDEFSSRIQNRVSRRLHKIMAKRDAVMHTAKTEKSKEDFAKLYRIQSTLLQSEIDGMRPVPGLEASWVKPEDYTLVDKELSEIMNRMEVDYMSWFDYANGILRVLPFLDTRHLSQRQKLLKLIGECSTAIIRKNGLVAINGGGRVTAAYHIALYGDVLYRLFEQIKLIFDPHNVLNPGIQFKLDPHLSKYMTTSSYTQGHRHNFLPS